MNKANSGFTLIEMIVTIVLIGLCVSVLIWIGSSYYRSANLKSISNKIVSDMTEITNGEELYFTKFQRYASPVELMESGIIKSFPIPPDGAVDYECLIEDGIEKHYEVTAISFIVNGNNNLYVVLPCAKEEVAETVNDIMQTLQ